MSQKELENEKEVQAESTVTLDDLKTAYIVGVTADDKFIFELYGKEKGLVQLLGIHKHATHCVDNIYNHKQMSGDRLTREVGLAVTEIAKKLDDLTSKREDHLLALKDQKDSLLNTTISDKTTEILTETVE